MVKDGRSGKLGDTGEVGVLQIIGGVQAAAGEDGVLDTGGQEVSEAHLQIEVIQFLQQTVFCVIGKVLQMIPVDLIYSAAYLFHERPANIRFFRWAEPPLHRLCNSGVVIFFQLP